jgi:hypothetical protein
MGLFSLIADCTFWVLLFFSKDEVEPRWRLSLVMIWLALWALSYFCPGAKFAIMSVVAIIDIGLLHAIFGEYATKV